MFKIVISSKINVKLHGKLISDGDRKVNYPPVSTMQLVIQHERANFVHVWHVL